MFDFLFQRFSLQWEGWMPFVAGFSMGTGIFACFAIYLLGRLATKGQRFAIDHPLASEEPTTPSHTNKSNSSTKISNHSAAEGKESNTKPHQSDPTPAANDSSEKKKIAADDLICPITLHLPFDPVIAEDGFVYERSAIETHFATNSAKKKVNSPISNVQMGKKLLPAPRIKNHIEMLIENGLVDVDLTERWMENVKQKKYMEALVKKAEGGNVRSMENVAIYYEIGDKGFKQDRKLAYKWYQQARVSGSVLGMAKVGELLALGAGTAKNEREGLMYLGRAEGQGSVFAACLLGMWLAEGKCGLAVDKEEASLLLQKSLSGIPADRKMSNEIKQQAQQPLDQL